MAGLIELRLNIQVTIFKLKLNIQVTIFKSSKHADMVVVVFILSHSTAIIIWRCDVGLTSCPISEERSKLEPMTPGPEVIKLFSCSAQLRLKFILLINV